MNNNKFLYIFVRKDLSLEQQIVQSMHVAIESGKSLNKEEHPSIVLFGIKNLEELNNSFDYLKEFDFDMKLFREPYYENELTSFSILNVTKEEKKIFKKFKLLRF